MTKKDSARAPRFHPSMYTFRKNLKRLSIFLVATIIICAIFLHAQVTTGPRLHDNKKGFLSALNQTVVSVNVSELQLKSCPNIWDAKVTDSVFHTLNITYYSRDKYKNMTEQKKLKKGRSLMGFLPIMNSETKRTLLRTYLVLKQTLERINVRHILRSGSLLGMHRFSGIMPWDDDMDVALFEPEWIQVRDALSCVKDYELMVDSNMRWCFFPRSAPRAKTMHAKKYPFIDIYFYTGNETHTWPISPVARKTAVIRKAHIFPTRMGLMEGIKCPIPNNPKAVLESEFGDLNTCQTQKSGHMDYLKGFWRLKCSELVPLYGNFIKDTNWLARDDLN